jgi:hypothetical protein
MPTNLIFILLAIAGVYYFGFTIKGRKYFSKLVQRFQKEMKQYVQDYERFYRSKDKVFNDTEKFIASQTVFSVNNKTAIAIDSRSNKICLLSNPSGIFPCDTRRIQKLIVSYKDILEVSFYEDGNSITKTSRTSQVAGAVVGNVLLGGAGLVIGALTGSKKTSNTIQSLEIRITVNNMQFPFWAFSFLRTETQKNNVNYKISTEEANKLLSLLKVIMNKADEEEKKMQLTSNE